MNFQIWENLKNNHKFNNFIWKSSPSFQFSLKFMTRFTFCSKNPFNNSKISFLLLSYSPFFCAYQLLCNSLCMLLILSLAIYTLTSSLSQIWVYKNFPNHLLGPFARTHVASSLLFPGASFLYTCVRPRVYVCTCIRIRVGRKLPHVCVYILRRVVERKSWVHKAEWDFLHVREDTTFHTFSFRIRVKCNSLFVFLASLTLCKY